MGKALIYGNTVLCLQLGAITKEGHFLCQWGKMNERLVFRESRIEVTRGSFPLNTCLLFNLSFHSISHMTYSHPDGIVLYRVSLKAPLYSPPLCDCGAYAYALCTVYPSRTFFFVCLSVNAVGLKAMINNGWPNPSLAKIHK